MHEAVDGSHGGHLVFEDPRAVVRELIPTMHQVLIIHEVADYTAWKKVFDGAADIRRDAGERSYQVLRYQNDPNRIVQFLCVDIP